MRLRRIIEDVRRDQRDQVTAADAFVAFAMAAHARLGSESSAQRDFFRDAALYDAHLLGEIFEFVDGRAWMSATGICPHRWCLHSRHDPYHASTLRASLYGRAGRARKLLAVSGGDPRPSSRICCRRTAPCRRLRLSPMRVFSIRSFRHKMLQ